MLLSNIRSNLTLALLCTSSVFALTSVAQAQDTSAETVVVTGSRVIADAANSPTPLTVVTTSQLTATSPTNLSTGLNKLPTFSGSNSSHTTANANYNGASDVLNLRNFGPQRTLVLLDGHRAAPSNTDGTVNIDSLPQMLMQRVDVVTGGASAIYGSDAVTGVVNFVLDKHFTGVKVDVNAGISTYEDGPSYNVGIAAGTDLFGGRGHIEGDIHAFHQDPILNSNRPTANQNWSLTGNGTAANPYVNTINGTQPAFTFGGKITCAGCAANGMQFVGANTIGPFNAGTATGNAGIQSGGDGVVGTNHQVVSMVSNEEAFGRFSYNINDDTTAYVQGSATQSYTKGQFTNWYIQPAPAASTYFANNAYLSPATQAQLANPAGTFQSLQYLNNHLGTNDGQITRPEENEFNITAGIDGELLGKYNWNVYYTHGYDRLKINAPHNLNRQLEWAANDAVAGAGGTIQCYVSTTTYASLYPGCVPIDPFGPNTLTQSQYNYVTQNTFMLEQNTLDDLGGSISGEVFDDWAGAVKAALSAESRWNSLSILSNGQQLPVNCTGLRLCNTLSLLWQGSTSANLPEVSENVWEFAGEVSVPLLKNVPLVQDLSLDLAGRYTNYSVTGSAETWKIGIDYHVNDEIRFRATNSVDIRAPTLYDLFSPVQSSANGFLDNHTGGTNGQPPLISQGNPNLTPEIGRTYTAGVVFTPEFLPGLTASVDYYHINMTNVIGAVSGIPPATQALCNNSGGTSAYCALYVRPFPFSNTTSFNYPTQIYSLDLNSAFQRTEGWDLELDYGFQLGDVWADAPGAINLRMIANIVPVLESSPFQGAPIQYTAVSEAGYGFTAATASKGKVTSFVSYNVGSWGFNLQDRWLSGFPRATTAGLIYVQPRVNSVNYQDITFDKKFTVADQTLDAYLSIQNIGNVMPPVALVDNPNVPGVFFQGIDNTNVSTYDPIGRYFTLGLRANF